MSGRSLAVYAVDVGSIRETGGNFAWARAAGVPGRVQVDSGTDIGRLVAKVVGDLVAGHPTALGFECPLFIPIRDEPLRLASARSGEGDRPWSASAGVAVLGTGMVQCIYILRQIARQVEVGTTPVTPTLVPRAFLSGEANLLVWEAFVSKGAKAATNLGDAELAARECLRRLTSEDLRSDVSPDGEVMSLIGAALLRSGLSKDLAVLSQPCLVVRVRPGSRARSQ